jgi:hypothetical protein
VIRGTAPDKIIFGGQEANICVESGYLATQWCSVTEVRRFNPFANPDEPVEPGTWIQPAPEFYCWMHNQSPGQFPIDPNHGGPVWSPPPPPVVVPPEPPEPPQPPDPPVTSGAGAGTP